VPAPHFVGFGSISRRGRPRQLFFEKAAGTGRRIQEQHAACFGAGVFPGMRYATRQEGTGARPTAGQAYYERARRILADVAEAEDVARRLQSELRGKLKVAAPMSFGLLHLSPAIAEFLVAHRQLEIELDLNDRRVDLVSEGHDLAIRIGKLPDSSLIRAEAGTLPSCRMRKPSLFAGAWRATLAGVSRR
jgi:DNA-binding transcriptional LysR family regulator